MYYEHTFTMKAMTLLLVLAFTGQALADEKPGMRATTARQDCVKNGMSTAIVAAGLVLADCFFFACGFTLTAAAVLPAGVSATTIILATPIAAGTVACAEGAVANVIVNN